MECNTEKCGAACCRILAFCVFEMTPEDKEYFEMHGAIVIKHDTYWVICIRAECKHLKENKCAIYDSRPQICKDGYSVKKEDVVFMKGCVFENDKNAPVLSSIPISMSVQIRPPA